MVEDVEGAVIRHQCSRITDVEGVLDRDCPARRECEALARIALGIGVCSTCCRSRRSARSCSPRNFGSGGPGARPSAAFQSSASLDFRNAASVVGETSNRSASFVSRCRAKVGASPSSSSIVEVEAQLIGDVRVPDVVRRGGEQQDLGLVLVQVGLDRLVGLGVVVAQRVRLVDDREAVARQLRQLPVRHGVGDDVTGHRPGSELLQLNIADNIALGLPGPIGSGRRRAAKLLPAASAPEVEDLNDIVIGAVQLSGASSSGSRSPGPAILADPQAVLLDEVTAMLIDSRGL